MLTSSLPSHREESLPNSTVAPYQVRCAHTLADTRKNGELCKLRGFITDALRIGLSGKPLNVIAEHAGGGEIVDPL